jgi:hypothetical protein
MAVTYQILPQEKRMRITLAGAPTRGEVLETVRHLMNEPDYHADFDAWVDVRGSRLEFHAYDVQVVCTFLKLRGSYVRGRVAILVSGESNALTAFLYKTHAESLHEAVEIFTEEDQALAWLERRVTSRA